MVFNLSKRRIFVTNSTSDTNRNLRRTMYSIQSNNSQVVANNNNKADNRAKLKSSNLTNLNQNTTFKKSTENAKILFKSKKINKFLGNKSKILKTNSNRSCNQLYNNRPSSLYKKNNECELDFKTNNYSNNNNKDSNDDSNSNYDKNNRIGDNNLKNNNNNNKNNETQNRKQQKILNKKNLIFSNYSSFQNFDFSSKENFEKQEKLFEQKLQVLRDQLEYLTNIENLSKKNTLSSELIELNKNNLLNSNDSSTSTSIYLSKLINEIKCLEKESSENISIVKTWHEKQKSEIDLQFSNESKQAIQDFQEKRYDLKENLKNENDEKKKQLEIDRYVMDINIDVTDSKPATTRKLRRRLNPIINSNSTSNIDFSADSENLNSCLDSSTAHILKVSNSVSSNSVLLQNNVIGGCINSSINTVSTSSLGSFVTLGSSMNPSLGFTNSNLNQHMSNFSGFYSTLIQPNYFSSLTNSILNNISSTINERKRKLCPIAITFTLNEDEINEDLKNLI